MLGRKNRAQLDLFITGSLKKLVPADHILARVNRVLDLGWLREEVADSYCADNGRPCIDPEVALRLENCASGGSGSHSITSAPAPVGSGFGGSCLVRYEAMFALNPYTSSGNTP